MDEFKVLFNIWLLIHFSQQLLGTSGTPSVFFADALPGLNCSHLHFFSCLKELCFHSGFQKVKLDSVQVTDVAKKRTLPYRKKLEGQLTEYFYEWARWMKFRLPLKNMFCDELLHLLHHDPRVMVFFFLQTNFCCYKRQTFFQFREVHFRYLFKIFKISESENRQVWYLVLWSLRECGNMAPKSIRTPHIGPNSTEEQTSTKHQSTFLWVNAHVFKRVFPPFVLCRVEFPQLLSLFHCFTVPCIQKALLFWENIFPKWFVSPERVSSIVNILRLFGEPFFVWYFSMHSAKRSNPWNLLENNYRYIILHLQGCSERRGCVCFPYLQNSVFTLQESRSELTHARSAKACGNLVRLILLFLLDIL